MMGTLQKDPIDRVLGGQEGVRLVNSFFVLYKNARIIEENNPTFQRQSKNFLERLSECACDSDDVTIKIVLGRYFVNEKMIRFDDQGLSGAASVVAEWKKLGLGGVVFRAGIGQDDVNRFFKFIAGIRPGSDNIEKLSDRLKTDRQPNVRLLSAREVDADANAAKEEVRRRFRASARTTFFKAASVVEEVMADTRSDREINTSKTKRIVHSLIDHITRDESSMIELTAIKNFDDYTYVHSTNVCVYALTLGVRLGMDRPRLSQLGFTCLFHDVGKVKLSADLIRKPDSYDEDDWIQMQLHPLLGAKTILRNLMLDTHTARAARGAFEHHINQDFTGYPTLRYDKRPVNLFSKIISIVDTFDALSSGRVYIRKAISPDEVLRKMHFQMKTKFDPFLLKIFTNIIGIYPAGSLVLLSSEEIALVLTNNESDRSRPYLKIVGNREGLLESPEWVDLAQRGQSHRKIIRIIDPSRYGLDIKDFVLQD